MKLSELEPSWIVTGPKNTIDPNRDKIGVVFNCPCGCKDYIGVMFSNPFDGKPAFPNGGPKWKVEGDNFDNMTLSPSIRKLSGCKWHGFVRNGNIETCGDSGK